VFGGTAVKTSNATFNNSNKLKDVNTRPLFFYLKGKSDGNP
jgi:hypothetical protein